MDVSVLFSEPKIPQSRRAFVGDDGYRVSFSALQRAENSSIRRQPEHRHEIHTFQCSSASRKFLNGRMEQRVHPAVPQFQCSSASRKFLNTPTPDDVRQVLNLRFSALQRAENSSILLTLRSSMSMRVSVLFSEPKIPQSHRDGAWRSRATRVSVLFSEPKIPQSVWRVGRRGAPVAVSVLFSEPKIPQSELRCVWTGSRTSFQCSSASRKFLNISGTAGWMRSSIRFSALQRAENSSIETCAHVKYANAAFQCSSASRKFLNSCECEW